LPRIVNNFRNDFWGFKQLLGAFLNVTRQDYEIHGWRALFVGPSEWLDAHEKLDVLDVGLGTPLLVVLLAISTFFAAQKLRGKTAAVRSVPLLFGLLLSIMVVLASLSRPRYMTIILPYLVLYCGALLSAGTSSRILSFRKTLGLMLCAALVSFSSVALSQPGSCVTAAEHNLARFLEKEGLKNGLAGYDIAHKVMFFTRKRVLVSSLAGPRFTTRFLDVERYIAKQGAEFVVYRIAGNDRRIKSLEVFLAAHGIPHIREVVDREFLVFRAFSKPIFPGSHLPKRDRLHFERHRPDNPRKTLQEKANLLIQISSQRDAGCAARQFGWSKDLHVQKEAGTEGHEDDTR
jgi:hypothetical protein